MSINLVIVGATGNVGREVLNILYEKSFNKEDIQLVASEKSAGQEISYGDETITVQALDKFDLSSANIAIFSAGGSISEEWAPKFAEANCIVIDNSSFYRMDPEVPLVVPEVNPDALSGYSKKNIIANPNCSTAQLVMALKPLHDISKIKRVVISTYQSVSGAGKAAMDELFDQTRKIFSNDFVDSINFTKRMAFNVIPHIDKFTESGDTKEEIKMMDETKKIIDKNIKIAVTCVRVPVFIGHSESVNIEFESKISEDQARSAIKAFPGCVVIDERKDGGYVTPIECAGNNDTYISRIREDKTIDNGLSLWVVSDNLRKGAALNAIQIAELLIESHL